jgi:tetratricopeptide (TPR) repeat protein
MAGVRQQEAQQALHQAMLFHQQGDMAHAKSLYKKAIKSDPKLTQAYNLLGVAMMQTGHIDLGIDHLKKALKLNPLLEDGHVNLGNGYRLSGRPQEAIAAYSHVLKLNPDNQDALNNRALAYQDLGRTQDALADFNKLIQINPSSAEFYFNLGTVLNEMSSFNDAVLAFELALEISADDPAILNNYAHALNGLERYDEALAACTKALDNAPDYTKALSNKGAALIKLGRFEEARACFEHVLSQQVDHAAARLSNALCLVNESRFAQALECLMPLTEHETNAQCATLLAQAHLALGDIEEARRYSAQACASDGHDKQNELVHAHILYATKAFDEAGKLCSSLATADDVIIAAEARALNANMALLKGDFSQWHIAAQDHKNAAIADIPEWQGEDIVGKKLYIRSPVDDAALFMLVRLIPAVSAKGAHVTCAVPPRLVSLVRSLKGEHTIIKSTDAVSGFDFQTSLYHLPHLLKLSLNTIADTTPYLTADAARVAAWRTKLGADGCKIGVVWRSDKSGYVPRLNDASLFRALSEMEHVRLISLHRDETDHYSSIPDDVKIETLGSLYDKGPDAFMDAAAVMQCCDLIISSDHALAHLAGALAKPVWIIIPEVAQGYWLCDRNDSPWYPTAALFRAKADNKWRDAFTSLEDLLRSLLAPDSA